jgi:CHAD domain-containing protein
MAFEFRADGEIRESVRRCAREELDDAIAQLRESLKKDPVEAVHAARKSIKKERALLRLVRGTLPRKQRVKANRPLRDAARELSGVRDRDVMIQAIDGLAERFSGQVPAKTFTAVSKSLATTSNDTQPVLAEEAVGRLLAVQAGIDDWRLRREGWNAIESGLLRTYRRGRKALRRARVQRTDQNLHEWRKRVKDHWYHLRLLAPGCGAAVSGQAKEAHQLSDLLGDDHDLALLKDALESGESEAAVDLDALIGLIDFRRAQLQADAIHIGERLYAEKPPALGRRIHRSWEAGRDQANAVADRRPAELADKTRA